MLNEEQFAKYVRDIAETKVWGGQVELKALAKLLGCQIEVIQAEGPTMSIGEEGSQRLTLTYHRHMYQLGKTEL